MNRLRELIDNYRYYIIGVSVITVVLLVVGLVTQSGAKTAPVQSDSFARSEVVESGVVTNESHSNSVSANSMGQSSDGSNEKLVVDIKGGVKSPGVYQMVADQRIADLVDAAGGFSQTADRKNVNLARKLVDQQVVYIPIRGEIKGNLHLNNARNEQSTNPSSDNSISNSTDNNDKININTADKAQLQTISGIGEKKAENIISYRQQKGHFKSIDEIKNADGIGDKMFENIKNSITI
ncbi:helix-hairpin-helix domain-containing protein [Lactobacillaceae bacterium Melli_B4]